MITVVAVVNSVVYMLNNILCYMRVIPALKYNKICFRGLQIKSFTLFTDEAVVSSVSLYLDVDFERKVLCGKVDLTVDKKETEVTHVVSLVA